jgi:hypothetical protein
MVEVLSKITYFAYFGQNFQIQLTPLWFDPIQFSPIKLFNCYILISQDLD